jgi:hypothetical protein
MVKVKVKVTNANTYLTKRFVLAQVGIEHLEDDSLGLGCHLRYLQARKERF